MAPRPRRIGRSTPRAGPGWPHLLAGLEPDLERGPSLHESTRAARRPARAASARAALGWPPARRVRRPVPLDPLACSPPRRPFQLFAQRAAAIAWATRPYAAPLLFAQAVVGVEALSTCCRRRAPIPASRVASQLAPSPRLDLRAAPAGELVDCGRPRATPPAFCVARRPAALAPPSRLGVRCLGPRDGGISSRASSGAGSHLASRRRGRLTVVEASISSISKASRSRSRSRVPARSRSSPGGGRARACGVASPSVAQARTSRPRTPRALERADARVDNRCSCYRRSQASARAAIWLPGERPRPSRACGRPHPAA